MELRLAVEDEEVADEGRLNSDGLLGSNHHFLFSGDVSGHKFLLQNQPVVEKLEGILERGLIVEVEGGERGFDEVLFAREVGSDQKDLIFLVGFVLDLQDRLSEEGLLILGLFRVFGQQIP